MFVNVGERTNVTGSRAFARLIRDDRFEDALDVARHQVRGGANLIDVNMDDEVIRGTTVVKDGNITWPPPVPKPNGPVLMRRKPWKPW